MLLQILLVINSIAERFQSPLRTVKLASRGRFPRLYCPFIKNSKEGCSASTDAVVRLTVLAGIVPGLDACSMRWLF